MIVRFIEPTHLDFITPSGKKHSYDHIPGEEIVVAEEIGAALIRERAAIPVRSERERALARKGELRWLN